MENIITPEQFAGFRADISKGWNKETDKIKRVITEAQTVDLFDVLDSFLFDVIKNLEETPYQDLLNGSEFTISGQTFMHIGLKNYLANLAYVRYLTLTNTTHTPHGFVSKINDNSEPVNWNQIRDIRKDTQTTNAIQFKMIDKYLCANPSLFPNYRGNNNPNINTFSSNFWTI